MHHVFTHVCPYTIAWILATAMQNTSRKFFDFHNPVLMNSLTTTPWQYLCMHCCWLYSATACELSIFDDGTMKAVGLL